MAQTVAIKQEREKGTPTHGDHTQKLYEHSKELKLALIEAELEEQHLPEKNSCEHSENPVDGDFSLFSIATILLFILRNFYYYSNKPIVPKPVALTFFPTNPTYSNFL